MLIISMALIFRQLKRRLNSSDREGLHAWLTHDLSILLICSIQVIYKQSCQIPNHVTSGRFCR